MSSDVKSVNGTTVVCVFWLYRVFTLVVVRSNFVYGEELANIQYTVHYFKLNFSMSDSNLSTNSSIIHSIFRQFYVFLILCQMGI